MKRLTNNEICLVSAGIGLSSAVCIGAIAALTLITVSYLISHSPAPTKEDELAILAVDFINSFNSY